MRFGWRRGGDGQPALAAIGEIADYLVGGVCDRLLRDLHQRDARHAPRRERWRARSSRGPASGIDLDINRNIELYDLSLRAAASNMMLPDIDDLSKPILHLLLFDRTTTAKHFGTLQVFDATGRLTIDASTMDPRPQDRADEEYFQVPSR